MAFDKAQVARYLLMALALVPITWAMWLVPLPQPDIAGPSGQTGSWQLAPLSPPDDPDKLAQRLAQRQGWDASSTGASPGSATPQAGQAQSATVGGQGENGPVSQILGIAHTSGQALVVLVHKQKPLTVAVGEKLPDGRRVKSIEGLSVTLEGKDGKSQTIKLFPVDTTKLVPPHDPRENASGQNESAQNAQ